MDDDGKYMLCRPSTNKHCRRLSLRPMKLQLYKSHLVKGLKVDQKCTQHQMQHPEQRGKKKRGGKGDPNDTQNSKEKRRERGEGCPDFTFSCTTKALLQYEKIAIWEDCNMRRLQYETIAIWEDSNMKKIAMWEDYKILLFSCITKTLEFISSQSSCHLVGPNELGKKQKFSTELTESVDNRILGMTPTTKYLLHQLRVSAISTVSSL